MEATVNGDLEVVKWLKHKHDTSVMDLMQKHNHSVLAVTLISLDF